MGLSLTVAGTSGLRGIVVLVSTVAVTSGLRGAMVLVSTVAGISGSTYAVGVTATVPVPESLFTGLASFNVSLEQLSIVIKNKLRMNSFTNFNFNT